MNSGKSLIPAILALLTLAAIAVSQASSTPAPKGAPAGLARVVDFARSLFAPALIQRP